MRDPFFTATDHASIFRISNRRGKDDNTVLSPPARRVPLESSRTDLSIILLKHAEPDTKQHFRCHSRTTALLWKWNKAIKGNNWVVPSLLAARTWAQHERHKSNCQSVEERWIWLHSKDHWLWACSRKGCECLCGLLGEWWICACLSQNGGPAVGYTFWRLIYRRAGPCELSVWLVFMSINGSV